MTNIVTESPPPEAMSPAEHPAWCGRSVVGCEGDRHRSQSFAVPYNDEAGCQLRVYLWGRERLFVDLDFDFLGPPSPGCSIDCLATRDMRNASTVVAADKTEEAPEPGPRAAGCSTPTGVTKSETTDTNSTVHLNSDDSLFVTDPHGHSLTLTQAKELHGALTYLIGAAEGEARSLLLLTPRPERLGAGTDAHDIA